MARALKWHLVDPDGNSDGLCGRAYFSSRQTNTRNRVNCVNCMKKMGIDVPATPKKPKPEEPKPDFEVTEDVQKALKYIGKIAAKWADRTNQCGTYDEAVKFLNTKMPTGARIPGRLAEWKIKIANGDEGLTIIHTARTSQDAVNMVKNQIRYMPGLAKASVTVVGEVE